MGMGVCERDIGSAGVLASFRLKPIHGMGQKRAAITSAKYEDTFTVQVKLSLILVSISSGSYCSRFVVASQLLSPPVCCSPRNKYYFLLDSIGEAGTFLQL